MAGERQRFFDEIAMSIGYHNGGDLRGLMGTTTPLVGPYLVTAAHVLDDLDSAISKYGGEPTIVKTNDDNSLVLTTFKTVGRWNDIDCALLSSDNFTFHPGQDRVLPNPRIPVGAGTVVQAIGFPNVSYNEYHPVIERGHTIAHRTAGKSELTAPPSVIYEVSFRAAPGLSGACLTMEYAGPKNDHAAQLLLGIVLGEKIRAVEPKYGELAPPPTASGYVIAIDNFLEKTVEGKTIRSILTKEYGMFYLD